MKFFALLVSSIYARGNTTQFDSEFDFFASMAQVYDIYFQKYYFEPDVSYVNKIDVEAYLQENQPIKEWDNTLPTLIYHGCNDHCRVGYIVNLREVIRQVGQSEGVDLYTDCIQVPHNVPGGNEKIASVYTSMVDQAATYCEAVKAHPVFGQSDFNIIGFSQGGLMARDMI